MDREAADLCSSAGSTRHVGARGAQGRAPAAAAALPPELELQPLKFPLLPPLLQVNTAAVVTVSRGMNHVEGGWPKEVDHTEAEQVGCLQQGCLHPCAAVDAAQHCCCAGCLANPCSPPPSAS